MRCNSSVADVIIVSMKDAHIRVDSCLYQFSFNPSIKNAIAIIQQSVDRIKRGMLRPAGKAEIFRKKCAIGIEICLRRRPLPTTQLRRALHHRRTVGSLHLFSESVQSIDYTVTHQQRFPVATIHHQKQCLLI